MDVVLLCCGDNFEEDLRWELKLVFVDLVELDDVANGVGVTLFKTVEAEKHYDSRHDKLRKQYKNFKCKQAKMLTGLLLVSVR